MARKARIRRAEAPEGTSTHEIEPRRAPALHESIGRYARVIAIAAVLLATVRIAATYRVFSHTLDEPAHIGAGMEWLDKKAYTWEPQHPPLARVAAAIGPYLLGARSIGPVQPDKLPPLLVEGMNILYGGYDKLLTAARVGILPFFWVACLVVFEWGRRYFDDATAAIAVVLFSFLPPVLAHAGLATTDMAVTAWLGAAFLSGMVWLDRPDWKRAAVFGVCTGLAVVSKFSTLVFLPAAIAVTAAIWYWLERPAAGEWLREARSRAPMFLAAVLAGIVVIWAAYRFSFHGVPAPELFEGIRSVKVHNQNGHPSYLLGEIRLTGWWYFFPVVLAVKTPLGFLALVAVGLGLAARRNASWKGVWAAAAFSAAILAVAMAGNIDIGVRHVLPIYIGMSLLAACGAAALLRMAPVRAWAPAVAGILAAWMFGSSLLSHPDYLAYFNEIAGDEPEKIVADSDLDWGQDLKRLAQRMKQVGAEQLTFMTFQSYDWRKQGFPPTTDRMDGRRPPPGWCAISLQYWKTRRLGLGMTHPEVVLWPDRVPPTEKVGKSIFLWHFPPAR